MFKTGDVVLFLRSGFTGWLVSLVGHKYKHAGMIYGLIDGRLFIVESVAYGVALNALDIYKPKKYHVYRFKGKIDDERLRKSLINRVNIGYDYRGLIGASIVAIKKLFKIKSSNVLQDEKLLYCSELVALELNLCGINSPEDLSRHSQLERIK